MVERRCERADGGGVGERKLAVDESAQVDVVVGRARPGAGDRDLCAGLLAASELEGGGSLISIASMAAYRSSEYVPGYGAAKAGIVNLTANLARRWASQGVRANAIAPGVIDTPMTAALNTYPELGDPERAHIPMDRFGTVDEVVGTALFLASSAASYLTGQTIAVDGGYLTV